MHKVLEVVGLLAAGGFITSFAEFKFEYNLIDLIIEKVGSIFHKAKAEEQAAIADVKKKL